MRAENGDILLLVGTSLKESTYSSITSTKYTHICMLFRDSDHITGEDRVYVLESGVGMSVKEGIRVLDFQYYLDRWRGNNRVLYGKFLLSTRSKQPFLRPSTEDILRTASDNLDIMFDRTFSSYFFPDSVKTPRKEMFCSEAIVYVLQRLGLISDTILPWSLSPDDISRYSCNLDVRWFFEEIDIQQLC
jgi:hypothetical protein